MIIIEINKISKWGQNVREQSNNYKFTVSGPKLASELFSLTTIIQVKELVTLIVEIQ